MSIETAAWPIRVGGVYRSQGSVCGGIYRVTAIHGDQITADYMWPQDKEPMSTNTYYADVFRMCAWPEDQSPIPYLIAALKAVEWGGSDASCPACQMEKVYGHADGCAVAEALQKAGA